VKSRQTGRQTDRQLPSKLYTSLLRRWSIKVKIKITKRHIIVAAEINTLPDVVYVAGYLFLFALQLWHMKHDAKH